MKHFFLSLLFLLPVCLLSQNLVPNPDFESYADCPRGLGQFHLANSWTSPNAGTPDYFNDCSTSLDYGTEFNKKGGQVAHSGHAYMGIQSENLNRNEFYEYLEAPLAQPLVADSFYCVKMFVSSGTSNAALKNLGVVFSQIELKNPPVSKIHIPCLPLGNGNILSDSVHWVCISGNYKARGGELFITIGDFSTDNNFVTLPNAKENAAIFQESYYFIDDVSVEKTGDSKPCINKP